MNLPSRSGLTRRKVAAAGLAALALGLPRPPNAAARVMFTRGMTGGGLAQLEGEAPRLAHFSLFASAIQFPDGNTLVLGSIAWAEPASGLQLVTTRVVSCVPMADQPAGAEIRGAMKVNGEQELPFVFQAIDAGLPGAGLDALRLEVNTPYAREGSDIDTNDTDFSYEAEATLAAGDFQWIIVDTELPG
jgi:hypothetical protein